LLSANSKDAASREGQEHYMFKELKCYKLFIPRFSVKHKVGGDTIVPESAHFMMDDQRGLSYRMLFEALGNQG
jgi:hypothetical protein